MIRHRLPDETIEDFDPEQIFEVGMLEGCMAGAILADGETESYFYGVTQPIKFVAAADVESDTGVVKLRIGLIEGGPARPVNRSLQKQKRESRTFLSASPKESAGGKRTHHPKQQKKHDSDLSLTQFCFTGEFVTTTVQDKYLHVVKRALTILLGETKYYQAKEDPEHADSLIIVERDTTTAITDPGWITGDVWTTNPVTAMTGNKLGTYWDRKYPRYINVKTQEADSVTMESLPAGLIRLTGLFWSPDTAYKVNLHATDGTRSGTITIEVKPPTSLGTLNRIKKNVSNKDVNIDSLAITHGGRSGIPPQIIKGQMQKESFFLPAFRYEPWKDIEFQTSKKKSSILFSNPNHFVVDSSGMGTGNGIPTTHVNVRNLTDTTSIDYPRIPTQIREYVTAFLREYAQRGDLSITNPGGGDIEAYWKKWYRYMKDSVSGLSDLNARRASLTRTAVDFGNGIVGGPEYDRRAQTRIVASYGFIQITHYTASEPPVLNGFTKTAEDHPPELLNEEFYGMPAYTQLLQKHLRKIIGTNLPEYNWNDGYEKTWTKTLHEYNSKEKRYEYGVVHRARKYTPRSN